MRRVRERVGVTDHRVEGLGREVQALDVREAAAIVGEVGDGGERVIQRALRRDRQHAAGLLEDVGVRAQHRLELRRFRVRVPGHT